MGKGFRFEKYRKAGFKWKSLSYYLQGVALTLGIAFLFYKSIFGLLTGVVIVPFWLKLKRAEESAERKSQMASEFKEYMMLVVGSLQAGYSLEKAVKQSEIELRKMYPKDSILCSYVHVLNQRISMNMQLEQAFNEFAKEIDLEEAISLSEIISFAKRSGGDYGKHIRQTALKIEDNLAIKQEIETITTEKRLELKVMCIMPMAILAYITLTSESFVAPLYKNVTGVCLMTVCLVLYGFFVQLGRKIIDIQV